MTKIIGMTGAHGTGKTAVLEYIKNDPIIDNIKVDDYKHSRSVLKALDQTLEEATVAVESTMSFQTKVLDSVRRRNYLLKLLETQGDVTTNLVDRSVADVYAYTRLWSEKNGIDPVWFEKYEAKCAEMVSAYDIIFVFPTGKIPFIDDGIRAKEDTQAAIAQYIDEFLAKYAKRYYVVQSTSIEDRASEIQIVLHMLSLRTPVAQAQ
jgi:nicotinamide riboside kinase